MSLKDPKLPKQLPLPEAQLDGNLLLFPGCVGKTFSGVLNFEVNFSKTPTVLI